MFLPCPSLIFLKICISVATISLAYHVATFYFLWLKSWTFLLSCIVSSLIIIFYLLASVMYFLRQESQLYLNDYAECMADTYFYGYLRKVVPTPEAKHEDSIKERLAEYKASHGLTDETFPFCKLFVLIPTSGYIPTILEKLDPSRIEKRQHIQPIRLDRAGVREREYKSAIYKIYYPNSSSKHITVAMVGGAPLLALGETCEHNPDLKKYKKKLVYMFYRKLSAKLKEHREFEDACEIVYFDTGKESLADYFVRHHMELKEQ